MLHQLIAFNTASILIMVYLASSALADTATFLPTKKICTAAPNGQSYVDRAKLMNWAVTHAWDGRVIPQDVWDLNGDGDLLYEEKLAVLSELGVAQICASGKCTEGDPDAIDLMKYSFLVAFDPETQDRYLVVTSKDLPDESWRDSEADLRIVFDYKNVDLRIKCLKKFEPEVAVPDVELPPEGADRPNNSGMRVALNRDDLGSERDDLRAIEPAKFSVTSDLENDGWTWAVEGYAGYRHEWEGSSSFGDLIPFVHVVEKSSDDAKDNIDKLGIGLDTVFYHMVIGDVQGGIEYLTDSKTNLDILAGQLFWFPPFGIKARYINRYNDIGDTGVELKIRPRVSLHGGSIFDRGSVEEIPSNSDYLRGGPGVRIQFRGTEGGSFEDFEFNTDAKYLFGIAGDTKDYYRIESSLNYFFPGQDHFSLGLSYTYGYQDETLEKEDLIEAVLGARF